MTTNKDNTAEAMFIAEMGSENLAMIRENSPLLSARHAARFADTLLKCGLAFSIFAEGVDRMETAAPFEQEKEAEALNGTLVSMEELLGLPDRTRALSAEGIMQTVRGGMRDAFDPGMLDLLGAYIGVAAKRMAEDHKKIVETKREMETTTAYGRAMKAERERQRQVIGDLAAMLGAIPGVRQPGRDDDTPAADPSKLN